MIWDVGDAVKEPGGEFSADDGGKLKDFFGCLVEAVDSGHDDVLDGARNEDFRPPLGQDVSFTGSSYGSSLLERFYDLFQEEGIPFRP